MSTNNGTITLNEIKNFIEDHLRAERRRYLHLPLATTRSQDFKC